jgi:hypothetical protein
MNANIPQVCREVNAILNFKFTKEEVRRASYKMKLEKLQILAVFQMKFIRLLGCHHG